MNAAVTKLIDRGLVFRQRQPPLHELLLAWLKMTAEKTFEVIGLAELGLALLVYEAISS